jgi:signal transduction histidine kinase
VFLEHDRQHRGSIEEGYQRSLATISHHLMNRVIALDALHWRLQRAEKRPSDLPEVNRDFQEILGTITSTIRRARDFLKPPDLRPRRFNLIELCARLVSSHLPASVSTSVLCADGRVQVFADRELVSVAFSEILSNVRKALCSTAQPEFQLIVDGARDRDITVRFCDNGPGVRPEIRGRIFDDYFSSWVGQVRGTGLGLGWARRVMRAHGGDIVLDESLTAGACFVVTLPRGFKGDPT